VPAVSNHLHGDPPSRLVAVTKSDATVYDPCLRAFRVGTTAGDVAVVDAAGNTVTIPGVQVGETVVAHVQKILSTGTTAAGITGFY